MSFVSFVSRHLMIALVRNTKNFPLTKTSRGKKRKTERRVVEKLPYCLNSNKKSVSSAIYKIILFSFANVPIIMKCEETNKKS